MNLSIEEEINLSTEMKRFSASQGFPAISELKTYEDNAVAKASGYISWSMAIAYAALELINAFEFVFPLFGIVCNQEMSHKPLKFNCLASRY